MILNTINNLPFYTFTHFDDSVRHCFTTRNGGVSTGVYESLNLSYTKGDDPDKVKQNYQTVCNAIGFDPEKIAFSTQIHETRLRVITEDDFIGGYKEDGDADGLMTNCSGITLVTFYADCVPLFFRDPMKNVIALSHAGWPGTLLEIGPKTVVKMKDEYGCMPGDILVGIGPSIGPCCFEVDYDVAEKFMSLKAGDGYVKKRGDKYDVDLWSINRKSLVSSGIKPENIETAAICTKCNNQTFFSHRQMGDNRGSLAAFMSIK